MRLVLLGHLSSFGEQWCCPTTVLVMMLAQLRAGTSILLSRLVAGGGAKSRKYAVGSLCVISLDNLGHTSSAPFHFQPVSRRTSKTEEWLLRPRLTWPIVCSLLYRSLASGGRHLVSSRPNRPIIAVRQEMIPNCWAKFHRTRLVLT